MASNNASKYTGKYKEQFDNAYSELEVTVKKFRDSLLDGFQVKDIGAWYTLATDSFDIAKKLFNDGFTQEQVIEIARYTYWEVNPNWPWIPEPLETELEKALIIDLAIPLAVGSAWSAVERFKEAKKL